VEQRDSVVVCLDVEASVHLLDCIRHLGHERSLLRLMPPRRPPPPPTKPSKTAECARRRRSMALRATATSRASVTSPAQPRPPIEKSQATPSHCQSHSHSQWDGEDELGVGAPGAPGVRDARPRQLPPPPAGPCPPQLLHNAPQLVQESGRGGVELEVVWVTRSSSELVLVTRSS
jgi:hypothetical protein